VKRRLQNRDAQQHVYRLCRCWRVPHGAVGEELGWHQRSSKTERMYCVLLITNSREGDDSPGRAGRGEDCGDDDETVLAEAERESGEPSTVEEANRAMAD
jgi:hypothetical protein